MTEDGQIVVDYGNQPLLLLDELEKKWPAFDAISKAWVTMNRNIIIIG